MALKKFDKVFYRASAARITTIAFAGTTPSGWTALPTGAAVDTSKMEMDKDSTTELTDGTTYVGSDIGNAEFSFINFAKGDYATIRTALLNKQVDLLCIDSECKDPAWALWGARLYPKLEGGEGETRIVCSGAIKVSVCAAETPVTLVSVT